MTTAYPIVPAFDQDAFSSAPGHVRSRTWIDDAGNTRTQSVKWLFNDLGAAAVVATPYVIRYNAEGNQNPSIAALAAAPTDTPEHVCVALTAVADQTWGYFVTEGFCEALVEGGTDVTKGDYLSADASLAAFKEDSTTRTKNSFAIYQDDTDETDTTPTARLIFLFGDANEILA